MRKTFQYRAYMNKKTEANCLQWLHLCRLLYNTALEQRIIAYKQHRIFISVYDQKKELPHLKKHLQGKYFTIRNVGRFKLKLSRPIEGNIKTVTIKKTSTGKWLAAFSCDDVPEKRLLATNKAIGIDVGLKHFLTDSEGKTVSNPRYFRKSEKLLRRRSRRLSRRKRGSRRRGKARKLVACTHEKIANQRKDFLHKTANYYIRHYDTICVENLTIKNMILNKHFSKSISDVGWGMFFKMLSYKAEEAGRTIIKVNPQYTSQKCSGCDKMVRKSLSVRTHVCTHCGLILDRDYNVALNILWAGQAHQATPMRRSLRTS